MIQVNQIKLPVSHSGKDLEAKIRKTLKLHETQPLSYRIVKKSIDARKKPDIFYVYSVLVSLENEDAAVKRAKSPNVISVREAAYHMPQSGTKPLADRPVIVGAGPAGLFCALLLAECGYAPILLERGRKVSQRKQDVEKFWETGILDTGSNVQFGEGGAGTFSDGKLNTAVKDAKNRNLFVLSAFVRFGAPEEILYDAKPHIGTDVLTTVIENMREYLLAKGAEIHFETTADGFEIEGGSIRAVRCGNKCIKTQLLVLAPGHSARDTFSELSRLLVPMQAKNFAVGFRVEHPQEWIDFAMYGSKKGQLPAAPYKVTANFPNNRGVYSFCMCPGGYVVNASSYETGLAVNGMSYSKRDGENANSAIIVSAGREDFGADDALAGMRYQKQLEKKAYALCGGKIPQQLYGDYIQNIPSKTFGAYKSCTKGAAAFSNLRGLLSPDMEDAFMRGMAHFSQIIPQFAGEEVILSGVESRTSSPVRILRDETFESEVKGIYPCGEGAGYAGGIMSAAMDGMKVAEAIINAYARVKE